MRVQLVSSLELNQLQEMVNAELRSIESMDKIIVDIKFNSITIFDTGFYHNAMIIYKEKEEI